MHIDFDYARLAEEILKRMPQPASSSATPNVTDWMDTKEAAAYLRCSTQFLEIARVKGGGPRYAKRARLVRYARVDLDAWMATGKRTNTSGAK